MTSSQDLTDEQLAQIVADNTHDGIFDLLLLPGAVTNANCYKHVFISTITGNSHNSQGPAFVFQNGRKVYVIEGEMLIDFRPPRDTFDTFDTNPNPSTQQYEIVYNNQLTSDMNVLLLSKWMAELSEAHDYSIRIISQEDDNARDAST